MEIIVEHIFYFDKIVEADEHGFLKIRSYDPGYTDASQAEWTESYSAFFPNNPCGPHAPCTKRGFCQGIMRKRWADEVQIG